MSGKDCCKVAEGFYVGRAERDERSKGCVSLLNIMVLSLFGSFVPVCRDRFIVIYYDVHVGIEAESDLGDCVAHQTN